MLYGNILLGEIKKHILIFYRNMFFCAVIKGNGGFIVINYAFLLKKGIRYTWIVTN